MTGVSEQQTHIVSKCPACGSSYRLRVAAAGRQARCKSCRAVFQVPAPQVALEDSVLSWLGPASKDADDDTQPDLQAGDAKSASEAKPPPPPAPKVQAAPAAPPPKPADAKPTPAPAKTPAAPAPKPASPAKAPARPRPAKRRAAGPVAPTGKLKLPPQPSGAGPKRLIPLRRPTR